MNCSRRMRIWYERILARVIVTVKSKLFGYDGKNVSTIIAQVPCEFNTKYLIIMLVSKCC